MKNHWSLVAIYLVIHGMKQQLYDFLQDQNCWIWLPLGQSHSNNFQLTKKEMFGLWTEGLHILKEESKNQSVRCAELHSTSKNGRGGPER